jgi:hypothetical protein
MLHEKETCDSGSDRQDHGRSVTRYSTRRRVITIVVVKYLSWRTVRSPTVTHVDVRGILLGQKAVRLRMHDLIHDLGRTRFRPAHILPIDRPSRCHCIIPINTGMGLVVEKEQIERVAVGQAPRDGGVFVVAIRPLTNKHVQCSMKGRKQLSLGTSIGVEQAPLRIVHGLGVAIKAGVARASHTVVCTGMPGGKHSGTLADRVETVREL